MPLSAGESICHPSRLREECHGLSSPRTSADKCTVSDCLIILSWGGVCLPCRACAISVIQSLHNDSFIVPTVLSVLEGSWFLRRRLQRYAVPFLHGFAFESSEDLFVSKVVVFGEKVGDAQVLDTLKSSWLHLALVVCL